MAQHDYSIANQGFPSFRTDLNNALSAINSNNSGTSAPTTTASGQIFADTNTSGKIIFKFYNGTAFVSVFEVNTGSASAAIPSTVSIEGESDPNAIPFAIALGG